MFQFLIKHYPMFLERGFFVQKSQYPGLSSILEDFCSEPGLLIQLSMKIELLGIEAFRFINSIFHENPELMIVATSSLMRIGNEKIEVREVNPERIQKKEQYLNYHRDSGSIVVVRVSPG